MAQDPKMPLTDVQWVLGHAFLSTTQRYLNPMTEDVIAGVLAFHAGSSCVSRCPHLHPVTVPRSCRSSSEGTSHDGQRTITRPAGGQWCGHGPLQ